jgi:hypothetical protein
MGFKHRRSLPAHAAARPLVESLEARTLLSAGDVFFVSVKGNDANPGTDAAHPWRHIQKAFDAATPGSTVSVLPGRYNEKPSLNVSGNATDGFITFQAQGKVVISGKGVAGPNVVFIANRNYVRIVGFDIRDNLKVSDGSGIRVTESADHIELRNNRIHHITGVNAMGITIYGTEPTRGISNLVIDGNEVFKCQPALSEAVSVNGNVHEFAVTNNYVHDNNNIGIDFIGGEGRCPDPTVDIARNGVCSGNRVTKNRFRGTARMAAGIFVDGGQDITVERNTAWRNDVGIGVGCVQPGHVASNVTVRDNFVYANTKAGLSLGGADESEGRVQNCRLANNTLYHNGKASADASEIHLGWGSDNVIENNIVSGNRGAELLDADIGSVNNASNYNLFSSPDGPTRSRFTWSGQTYVGIAPFRAASAEDANSIFADPGLISPRSGNLRVKAGSPILDAGNPAYTANGELDIDGRSRPLGARVDIGAQELG